VVKAPIQDSSPETGGYGLLGCSVSLLAWDRLVRPFFARAARSRGVLRLLRDDAPGYKLGADPADRLMVNVGSVPAVPAEPSGSGQAHRPLLPPGRGGGLVVVVGVTTHRGGRESRLQGEGAQ